MLLFCIGLILLAEYVLRWSVYRRTLSAVGQNRIAAPLAGVPVDRVVRTACVISAVLASLMGLVLGACVGGALLEMGQPYLLQSIADGRHAHNPASAIGVFFAGFLMILWCVDANHATAARLAGHSAGGRPHPRAGARRSRRC